MITPEIKSKLAKIYELVKQGGTDGEKAAAETLLDKLLSKYNLTGIDLNSLALDTYSFKYTSELEKDLMIRIIRVMTESPEQLLKLAGIKTRGVREIILALNYTDYITIQCAYEYFRRHMKQQWNKYCADEVSRCRKAKTKNKRRAALQQVFFNRYVIVSKLYKPEELTTEEVRSNKEYNDRMKVAGVQGGNYKTQVQTGLLLN